FDAVASKFVRSRGRGPLGGDHTRRPGPGAWASRDTREFVLAQFVGRFARVLADVLGPGLPHYSTPCKCSGLVCGITVGVRTEATVMLVTDMSRHRAHPLRRGKAVMRRRSPEGRVW